MNILYKGFCRTYQFFFKLGIKIMPWRIPELIEGEGKIKELASFIKKKELKNVLIVTDKTLVSLGLLENFNESLKKEGLLFVTYDKTVPNPTIYNVEEGLKLYKENNCDCIVAFGGGSPMDCAKAIGARAVKPNKSIAKMKGYFKILKKLPPIFAVPTTAGTGSETTVAAVISNSETHEKYPINDLCLIPRYAVLDPLLTLKLPKHITSTTGIDALTHSVEAYIGRSNTKLTEEKAKASVKLIFDNIKKAYDDGNDKKARANMQFASFYGGIAFTRAYIGYVHAIAHTLGGLYGTPHGLANAVILPYVLDFYGQSAHKRLAHLADVVGFITTENTNKSKAEAFIQAIRDLNASMEIPEKIKGLKKEDYPLIIKRAMKESHPNYPVPKFMNYEDMLKILEKLTVNE